MKKHHWILLGCFILACLSGALIANKATANDSRDVSITITKYGRVDDKKINAATPNEPMLVTDNFGNQVQAVSGIEYTVDLVTPTGKAKPVGSKPSTYAVVTNDQALHFQGRTDQQGVLALGTSAGLTHGLYVVRELPNQKLAKTMTPVIVDLHEKQTAGKDDTDHIYLYPKSSFDDSDEAQVKPTDTVAKVPLIDEDEDIELPDTDGADLVKKAAPKADKPTTLASVKNAFPTTGMGWVELLMRIMLAMACFTLVVLMLVQPKAKRRNKG